MRSITVILAVLYVVVVLFDGTLCRSMGAQYGCDDGRTNLTVDWDGSSTAYTCSDEDGKILGSTKPSDPIVECDKIPIGYRPGHVCMDEVIEYDTPMPTHARHRPVWAKYGEYKYVPPQRWSHNVEHGAVVMLYHPCTQSDLVTQLKDVVTGCIRKHIITASNLIPRKTPLVLIAWGCRYMMQSVDNNLVKEFIETHAMRGPEGLVSADGQYDVKLKHSAKVVSGSTYEDTNLCPN